MAAVKITTFNANRASALLPECLEKELPCLTSSNRDALLGFKSVEDYAAREKEPTLLAKQPNHAT